MQNILQGVTGSNYESREPNIAIIFNLRNIIYRFVCRFQSSELLCVSNSVARWQHKVVVVSDQYCQHQYRFSGDTMDRHNYFRGSLSHYLMLNEDCFSAAASGDGLGEVAADALAEQAAALGPGKQDAGPAGDGTLHLRVVPHAPCEQNRWFAGKLSFSTVYHYV